MLSTAWLCLGWVRVLHSVLRQWHLFAQTQEIHRDQFRLTPEPPLLLSPGVRNHLRISSHGTTQPGSVPCSCSLVILCHSEHRCVLTPTKSRESTQTIRRIAWKLQIAENASCYPPTSPIADVGLDDLSEFFHSKLINFKKCVILLKVSNQSFVFFLKSLLSITEPVFPLNNCLSTSSWHY